MLARVLFVLASGAGLAACQPAIPESGFADPGRGVGFETTAAQTQQAQSNAALATSNAVPAPTPVSSAPLAGSAEATAAETSRVLAATNTTPATAPALAATNSGAAPVVASPSNPPPAVINSDGISQENNFEAVSALRDIESDQRKIDENRAQYRLVQPEALPSREATGANVVAYALQNTHPVGTAKYSRGAFNTVARSARKCAQFARPVEAQIAFLEAGGPTKDRGGLDPDGDGYACGWDPAPFRNANQAAALPSVPATPAVQTVVPADLQISTE